MAGSTVRRKKWSKQRMALFTAPKRMGATASANNKKSGRILSKDIGGRERHACPKGVCFRFKRDCQGTGGYMADNVSWSDAGANITTLVLCKKRKAFCPFAQTPGHLYACR